MSSKTPSECQTLTYGCHPASQVRPLSHRFRQDGLEAVLTTPKGEVEITSRLVGPFNLANILAAVATALGSGSRPGHHRPGHRRT